MRKAIPYGRQSIDQKDIDAVVEIMQTDFLTQGPKVIEFEQQFAKYVNAKYAISVSSGTAALHVSCIALNIKPGQKVITTPITFAASSNCVLYCGGEIDFCDIDPETYLMDLDKLEDKLIDAAPGTYAGIIPVDFTGLPVNTERLGEIAGRHDLWIIEDACHAPGGYYIDSKKNKILCGSNTYSDLTCFSFHAVKHIACGEGGMVTTNNKALYEKLAMLRTHGITKFNMSENHGGWYYEMQELGHNYRISDINCALGITQLQKADKGLERRFKIADRYIKAFKNHDSIELQFQPEGFQNAYHLFVIKVKDRKTLYDYLREEQIFTQIHYIPVHRQPYYKKLGWNDGDMPKAEQFYLECISLPMYPALSNNEQDFVINSILQFYNNLD